MLGACRPTFIQLCNRRAHQPAPLPPTPPPRQAPNPDDPLNKEAAAMMQQSPAQFERLVAQSVSRGCTIGSDYFPPARGERSG